MRQIVLALTVVCAALVPEAAYAAAPLDGKALRWPWALPFIGILLTIATGPLLFPRIWHRHYGKLAFIWAALAVVPIAALYDIPTALAAFAHAMLGEYLSFIVVLFALYVVAGGILVTGNLRGTPITNTAILALGTAMASVVGTTGAAMILIRPLLAANAARLHNVHVVVFFIFLVANIGGALTPLGDPPLFVGFLHGVDFFWTAQHLWLETTLVAGLVLLAFVLLDLWFYRKDRLVTTVGESRPPVSLRISGLINFVLIAAIIAAILGSAAWKPGITFDVYGTTLALQNVLRDCALVLIAILSLVLTPNEHREANGFTWEPIGEVAILFAGIFICIIPVLAMLQAGKDGTFAWLRRDRHERGPPAGIRLFLADRNAFGLPRQRPDLSRVLRARRRRRRQADGSARAHAQGDLDGRGLHGRADLYRQRTELHGLCDRGRARRQDAELFRLHGVVGGRPAADLRAAHFRFRREALVGARPPRALEAGFARAAAGSTATASISNSAPSRARPEIAMVVLAGRFVSAR